VDLLDLHPLGSQVLQRLPGQVISLEPDERWLQEALPGPDDPRGALDVLQQQHPPTRLQYPDSLGDGLPVTGNRTQTQLNTTVSNRSLGNSVAWAIALPKIHLPAELTSAAAGLGQHGGAEVQPGEPHLGGIEGQVQAGPHPDLEDVSTRL